MNKIFKLLALSALFLINNAFAILELEITQGANNTIPVVITPFDGAVNNQITNIINNDLKNSGRFKLENGGAGKVDAVVNGNVVKSGSELQVTFDLTDFYSKNKLLEQTFNVKSDGLRKLAHHISDLIYQKLTGDRGIFSTKIAYVLVSGKGRSAKHSLYIADSDGFNPRMLVKPGHVLMSPAWSPDGRKLAYVSFEGNRAAIYEQDINSGARRILSKFPGINGAPSWSPDGSKLALVLTQTGHPKIYILDIASKHLERITDGLGLDTEPSWAPDGKSIIFTSDRGGSPQIYRIYTDNKNIQRVTFSGSYNARASFTGDGNSIVMLHKEGDMFSIAQQELNSQRVTVLTQFGRHDSPSIAPNGKMVVYGASSGGRGMLAEVSIDGRVKLLLPTGEGAVQEPAWSPFLN